MIRGEMRKPERCIELCFDSPKVRREPTGLMSLRISEAVALCRIENSTLEGSLRIVDLSACARACPEAIWAAALPSRNEWFHPAPWTGSILYSIYFKSST